MTKYSAALFCSCVEFLPVNPKTIEIAEEYGQVSRVETIELACLRENPGFLALEEDEQSIFELHRRGIPYHEVAAMMTRETGKKWGRYQVYRCLRIISGKIRYLALVRERLDADLKMCKKLHGCNMCCPRVCGKLAPAVPKFRR